MRILTNSKKNKFIRTRDFTYVLLKYVLSAVMLCFIVSAVCERAEASSAAGSAAYKNLPSDISGRNNAGIKNGINDGDENEPAVEEDEDVSLEDIYKEKGFLTEKDIESAFFEFDKKEYAVIYGDTIYAGLKCNIPEGVSRIEYGDISGVAGLSGYSYKDKTVGIEGFSAGKVTVSMKLYVTFSDEDGLYAGEKMFEAKSVVKVLPTFTVKLMLGESYKLDYTDYDEYSGMTYVSESVIGSGCVEFSENNMTAVAVGQSTIYIECEDGKKIRIGFVYTEADNICFAESAVNRAVGSVPYKLQLNNVDGRTVTWSSSQPLVASVGDDGTVTPISVGSTVITATVKLSDTKNTAYTCMLNVTNPVLNVSSFNLAKGCSMEIGINGTTSGGSWSSSNGIVAGVQAGGIYYSNTSMYYNYGATASVQAYKKGTAVISVEVDGVVRTVLVTVTEPKIKKDFYIVTKGTKHVIKLSGTAAGSTVTFTSVNKKAASVSSKGIVRVKKTGYCPVIVDVDGARFVVSFNSGNKKAVKAVNNALKAEGAIYSQARRMQKGYYDCSSLVWRSYKGTGMYFGDRHYAPVAANEAAYCVRTKKNVPAKYINKPDKLNVGDLIFYGGSKKNGRYKNIYHVAIYMGQSGESFGGKIYTYGRIVHANGSRVSQGFLYNQQNCVVVGRPYK